MRAHLAGPLLLMPAGRGNIFGTPCCTWREFRTHRFGSESYEVRLVERGRSCDGERSEGPLALRNWREQFSGERWRQLLENSTAESGFREQFRRSTRTGRPCCDADDLLRFEEQIGRLLRAKSCRPTK